MSEDLSMKLLGDLWTCCSAQHVTPVAALTKRGTAEVTWTRHVVSAVPGWCPALLPQLYSPVKRRGTEQLLCSRERRRVRAGGSQTERQQGWEGAPLFGVRRAAVSEDKAEPSAGSRIESGREECLLLGSRRATDNEGEAGPPTGSRYGSQAAQLRAKGGRPEFETARPRQMGSGQGKGRPPGGC